uniref:CSON010574 protein n=1 Tax=Culicoides sonorensis TaxID=179676 RepID=A0A336M1Z4_CULSO
METPEDQHKKRKFVEEPDENDDKPSTKRFLSEPSFNLIDFSDEMLLAILKHLDSPTLIKLSRTCTRFHTLAQDHTHWSIVDFTSQPFSCSTLLQLLFRDVCQYSEIKDLKLRGQVSLYPLDKWKNHTVTSNMIKELCEKCPKLENLTIEDAFVDPNKVTVISFPEKLRALTLKNIHLSTSHNPRSSFFSKINFHFKNLEELAVENCNWFDTHDLIAFSKIPNLKYLSLRGCNSFKDCVPYGSIATRFGFQALEVLDVRDTPVTDSDIQCFNMTKSLKELRLQCPKTPEKKEEDAEKEKAEHENISAGDRPGTSGEVSAPPSNNTESKAPNPISASVHVRTDRQVINLHLRPSRNNGRMESVRDHLRNNHNENNPNPVPNQNNNDNVRHEEQENEDDDDDEEIQEAGAEFNSGNNNVRINIRNQNVQGRNVIHIVLQNNHHCNRNNNNNNPNNGENNGEENQNEGNDANRPQNNEEDGPGADNNPEAPLNANEQNLADGGVQHYIMIRGIREGADNENGDDINPARIVHPDHNPELFARLAHSNPYQFYDRFIQFQRSHPLNMNPGPLNLAITDRGICSFGHSRNNANGGLIWIRTEQRSPTTQLESITVRDYKMVTDTSLQHLSSCAPHLKFLDVFGTEVTQDGIEKFKLVKPECRVVSSFGIFGESVLKSVL